MSEDMKAENIAAEGKQNEQAGDAAGKSNDQTAADASYATAEEDYCAAAAATADTDLANKWLKAAGRVRKKMTTDGLIKYAGRLSQQAGKLEQAARNAPKQEGRGGATEIYPRAAAVRGRAADAYLLAATRLKKNADLWKSVGDQDSQQATDFERAAQGEPASDADERNAYWEAASNARHYAAIYFERAGRAFNAAGRLADAQSAQTQVNSETEGSYSDLLSVNSVTR